jgi:hypothetical protein
MTLVDLEHIKNVISSCKTYEQTENALQWALNLCLSSTKVPEDLIALIGIVNERDKKHETLRRLKRLRQ